MSEWRELPLGSMLELKRGYDLPNTARREGSVPIISSSGPTGTHDVAKVQGPGVVTGRYGTLGSVFFITEDFWPLNTSLYVRDFKGNDPRFTAELLRTMNLGQYDGASAVPGLNRNQLHTVPVHIPDLETQEKIAEVAGFFTDLIQNNRRRVQVLEEMARATYREWFVKFRYPGHETVSLVDSPFGPIPQGWDLRVLGDVVELKYGKALKADSRNGGSVAVVGSSGIVGWHDELLINGPAIVVGRKGNVGSVTWLDGASWPIDTTYYVHTALPLRYVAEQLRRTEFINSHSAVPGLSRELAYSKQFLFPPASLMDRYEKLADAFGLQVSTLARQAENLSGMRDLLLPKLVTGQIEVSSLDLDRVLEGAVA